GVEPQPRGAGCRPAPVELGDGAGPLEPVPFTVLQARPGFAPGQAQALPGPAVEEVRLRSAGPLARLAPGRELRITGHLAVGERPGIQCGQPQLDVLLVRQRAGQHLLAAAEDLPPDP